MTGSLNRYRINGTFECDEVPGNTPLEAEKMMHTLAEIFGIRVKITGVTQVKNWWKVEAETK